MRQKSTVKMKINSENCVSAVTEQKYETGRISLNYLHSRWEINHTEKPNTIKIHPTPMQI